MNGAANGTSRRGFLGRAAGAAAVVAGAGVGAGAITGSAAAAKPKPQRSYTAGRFALDIDGVNVGLVAGLDGGVAQGNVVVEDQLPGATVQLKHLSGVKYDDFTVQVGSAMGKPMYDWIKASFDKGYQRKNGALIAADFNYKEKSRHTMSQAFISEVTIPALDGASKEAGYLAVGVTAPKVTDAAGSGAPVQAAKQKAWLCSNFAFQLDGLDTSRVASIDSFTWKCSVAPDGSQVLDVSDIGVTFPKASLSSWQQWYQSLASGADDERDGALTLVGASGLAINHRPREPRPLQAVADGEQAREGRDVLREGELGSQERYEDLSH
jgi:hypothetical protein